MTRENGIKPGLYLIVTVPKIDNGSRSSPVDHRRDWVLNFMKRNASAAGLQIESEIRKAEKDIARIRLVGSDEPDVKKIVQRLGMNIKWHYDVCVEYHPENRESQGTPSIPQNPQTVQVNSAVWDELAEYKRLGSPEEIATKLKGLEREVGGYTKWGTAEEIDDRIKSLQSRTDDAERIALNEMERSANAAKTLEEMTSQFKNLENLPFEEIGVLLARKALQEGYKEVAARYQSKIPEGLDAEMRRALEGDERFYVINKDVETLCSANQAGISLDPSHSLDEILEEATERSKPFESSEYYKENILKYFGAWTIVEAKARGNYLGWDEHQKQELTLIFNDAESVEIEFKEQEKRWKETRGKAEHARQTIADRRKEYQKQMQDAESLKVEATVPLVALGRTTGDGREIYFILPTNAETEKTSLTDEMWVALATSIRKVVGSNIIGPPSEREARGSKLIGITLDKKYASSNTDLLDKIRKEYNNRAIAKLGVKIELYDLGGIISG